MTVNVQEKPEQSTEKSERTAAAPSSGVKVSTVDTAITENTARSLKLHEQAIEERYLRRAESSVHTREKMVAESQKQVNESGWIDSMSGTKAALEKDVQNEKRQLKLEQAKVEEIRSALERADALRVQAEAATKRGDTAEAERITSQAHKILNAIDLKIDAKGYRAGLEEQTKDLEQSADKLQTAMTVTKVVRDGAVITAATIATGGAFTAAAGGASFVVVAGQAVAIGTATGTGVGLLSNTAGAIEEGFIGDKSVKELTVQVMRQTGKDAVNSFVASASTAATMGVGGQVGNLKSVQNLTSGLGQTGSKIATSAVGGAITGAANGTFMVTVQTSMKFAQARSEFNSMAKENNWTGAERDERYAQFLEARGLTAEQLLKTGGITIVASAAGGAIGGSTAAVQQTLKTAASKVLVSGASLAADGAVSVGAAAIQGDMSKGRIVEILGATLAGHAVGYMAQKAELSKQPKLEKGLDLITEKYGKAAAEEFRDEIGRLACKERGMELTPENIKAGREMRLSQAGEQGALKCLDKLAGNVEKLGAAALKPDAVEKACETEMAKFTEKFCRDNNLDKIVDKHTTQMLRDVTGSSKSKLAESFEGMGLSRSEALETAKLVKGAFKSGKYDNIIKQKLEDKITAAVSADLKSGMEASFKKTFRDGLSGESQTPEGKRLQKAMDDKGIKLKKEELDELTEAGWRGAQRGIERGVRTVVREGIDAAFERFRRRGSQAESMRMEELPKMQRREGAPEVHDGREKHTDSLRAAKDQEGAAREVVQQIDEVVFAGIRYERILARQKDGNWLQVGLHRLT